MTDNAMELVMPAKQVPYREGLELQRRLVEERIRGARPDSLILLEHGPVITLGKNADIGGVVVSSGRLETLGIELHRVERGGQATYHGPGQLVGYPIIDLKGRGLGVRKYVEKVEEVMIRAVHTFGVEAYRLEGRPGVFCAKGKIGALGIAVTRGVSFHGFALNASPELAHYECILPCGMRDIEVVSLESVLGVKPVADKVKAAVLDAFSDVFQVELIPAQDTSSAEARH